jgi:hypothetical protein
MQFNRWKTGDNNQFAGSFHEYDNHCESNDDDNTAKVRTQ